MKRNYESPTLETVVLIADSSIAAAVYSEPVVEDNDDAFSA